MQALALSLRNHLADPVMVAIGQLSRWQVALLSSAAVLFWLFGAWRGKAALHWLIAIVGDEPMMRAVRVQRTAQSEFESTDLFDTVAPRLNGFGEPSRFRF